VFMSGVAAANIGNETQVFGTDGTIRLSNGDEKLYFAKAGESFKDISVEDPHASLEGVNRGIWNVSVVGALKELYGAITEDRRLERGASFVDGLRNQMVVDAVFASTKSRKWEDLDMEGAV